MPTVPSTCLERDTLGAIPVEMSWPRGKPEVVDLPARLFPAEATAAWAARLALPAIPWLETAYQIGDRLGKVQGREIDLGTRVGHDRPRAGALLPLRQSPSGSQRILLPGRYRLCETTDSVPLAVPDAGSAV